MVSTRSLLSAILAASSVSAAVTGAHADAILQQASSLLKRQEPGTPAYNCHNTCGQALRQGRFSGDARCTNDIFLTNYKYCLQCSGPDNVGIWSFYGNTVGVYGAGCGLSTNPLAGKQPDVPEAIPAVEPGAVIVTSADIPASSSSSLPVTSSPAVASSSAAPFPSSATSTQAAATTAAAAASGSGVATSNAPTSTPVRAGSVQLVSSGMVATFAVAILTVGAQVW